MAIHEEVLQAANQIACMRADWSFTPEDIVRALPQLNENSVRTHVVSRCCKNAPKNHAHKWDYFQRIGRGRYQVETKYRVKNRTVKDSRMMKREASPGEQLRQMIHCIVHREAGTYIAECLEFGVVTQGATLDEVVENVHDALALHLEDEDMTALGFSTQPRLQIVVEMPLAS